MSAEERVLTEAAARLTVEDFRWLQEHQVITGREQPPGRCVNVTDPEKTAQAPLPQAYMARGGNDPGGRLPRRALRG